MPTPSIASRLDDVLLRAARADDGDDLIRLAALDSAPPPAGPALVAEKNGAIVAALCLSTGRAIADPFLPSVHLVDLLRRHAASRQAPETAPHHRAAAPARAQRGRAMIGAERSW